MTACRVRSCSATAATTMSTPTACSARRFPTGRLLLARSSCWAPAGRPGRWPLKPSKISPAGVSAAAFDVRRAGVQLRDLALTLYTSGTAAQPRGALLTHESIVRAWLAMAHRLGMHAEDRCWNPLPFFHIAGLGVNVCSFATGATVLTDGHFRVDEALALISDRQATLLFFYLPSLTLAVLNHPRFDAAALGAVRAMVNTAPPRLMREMQARLPDAIQCSSPGMTETGGPYASHQLDDDPERRATTVGGSASRRRRADC
jgi:fatty-acyl-CoA synthase